MPDSNFFSFTVVWQMRFRGWGLGFVLRVRIQLMGFGVCGEGPSGFFLGVRDLHKHRRITLGRKLM